MLKKTLLLAAALLFTMAGTAAAQDAYPPADSDTVTVSDSTVEPGQTITLSARSFQPGSTVTFTLFSAPVVLGTATADADGVATLTATIPTNTTPGSHTIEATGVDNTGAPLTVTTTITVVGAGAADLPTTGSSSTTPMTQLAIAAVAGGGLLVLLANRRRASAPERQRETAGV